MAAEPVAHGREQLALEIRLAARSEPRIKRRGKHRHRHTFINGGFNRPSAFAGVRHPARELRELGIFGERIRRQIQQPRSDDAAAPPHLGDVAQIELIFIVFRIAQRRRLAVGVVRSFPDIGVAQDA